MSFFRSFLLKNRHLFICLISLIVSAALFYVGSLTEYGEFRNGYAVLSTDESVDDRELISLLNDEHVFTGGAVGESSQTVMFDNFDFIESIPLDKYFSRIHSFDPRYDGYAEKLRDVFIKDGKRFVYMPLQAGNWNAVFLDKKFSSLLGDIPFDIDYYGIGRPLFLFFIMYAAASVFLFIICCVKRKSHQGMFKILILIPVFSSLAFFGVSGLVCAGLFAALFIMLKEPLSEFVSSLNKTSFKNKLKSRKAVKDIIISHGYYILSLFTFAAAFAVIIIFSQIKVFFVLSVFIAAMLVFFISLKILSLDGGKHRRFSPVMIIKRASPEFIFPVYMIPFAAAALLTFFLVPYMSGSYVSENKFDAFVEERDYRAHLANQASFSGRPLGKSADFLPEKSAFFFDADGLPSMKISESSYNEEFDDFPPFPVQLKDLMNFFHKVNSGERTNSVSGKDGLIENKFKDIISWLVLLIFIFTGFIIKRKNDYSADINFSAFEGIVQKFPIKYINWNKTLVYNSRSQKHRLKGRQYDAFSDRRKIQKDA